MNRLFITGIPTSGKSYLAQKLAAQTGGIAVLLDDMRSELATDERYRQWTNFYLDKDEKTYYETISPEEQWDNLVRQSEGLWPAHLQKMLSYKDESRPVIFESVNILPHLARRDLPFGGVVLIGKSLAEIQERLVERPRWGFTPELQSTEAQSFFTIERPKYESEAQKHGYPVFESADDAFPVALQMLRTES